MSDMTRDDILAHLEGLSQRRTEAFSAGVGKGLSSREHLALIPESTTAEDIDVLHAARLTLSPDDRFILDLYAEVWREWGRPRCSVCGMTPQQAKAADYDCVREC